MKKLIVMMSYVLICLLAPFFSACNEEDWLLSTPVKEKPQYFSKNELGYAYLGLTLNGDTVVFLSVKLKETTIPVAPEKLQMASLLKDLPIQKNESTGKITADQTFISDDGQESYLHLEAKAPEYLMELVKIQTGYQDYRFEWADPTPTPIGNMAMLTEHITPMLLDENGESIGSIPALEPWYYHTALEPEEPEPLTVKVDTLYMYQGGEGYFKIKAVRSDGKVLVDHKALPLYSDGAFHGSNIYHAAAPARFDTSVGNNGLVVSVEPQTDRSYAGKVLDEYTTATLRYGCYRVKSSFVGDGEGTSTTECVIDYWVMEYTFHDPESGWTLTTHSIELTHEVTQNELQSADGTLLDAYGKPHHLIGKLLSEVTSKLILNGKKDVVNRTSDISHISEWREK